MDAVEMHEPYTYLNGLTVDDLEDLLVDIGVYRWANFMGIMWHAVIILKNHV